MTKEQLEAVERLYQAVEKAQREVVKDDISDGYLLEREVWKEVEAAWHDLRRARRG